MPAGTAPGKSTWDVTPQPYRPGGSDFNGAALINDAENPPDPATMPTAELFNTMSLLLVSLGKVAPNAVISVTGGNPPVINAVTAAPSAVVAGTFTVTRNAAGDVSLTWPASTFPAPLVQPTVSLNLASPGLDANNYAASAVNIANGVRVTTSKNAALTDLNFTVVLR